MGSLTLAKYLHINYMYVGHAIFRRIAMAFDLIN